MFTKPIIVFSLCLQKRLWLSLYFCMLLFKSCLYSLFVVERTSSWACCGPGLWNGTDHSSPGTLFPESGGHWCERVPGGGGQGFSRVCQCHLQVCNEVLSAVSSGDNVLWVKCTAWTLHYADHRSGPAEELPFPDGSVDLLTAASAAHWFDTERFLKEAERVLKPHGCIALLGYTDEFSLHYGSCGEKLNNICEEVSAESFWTGMFPLGSSPVQFKV